MEIAWHPITVANGRTSSQACLRRLETVDRWWLRRPQCTPMGARGHAPKRLVRDAARRVASGRTEYKLPGVREFGQPLANIMWAPVPSRTTPGMHHYDNATNLHCHCPGQMLVSASLMTNLVDPQIVESLCA